MTDLRLERLYEGKAKTVYRDSDSGALIQRFKDSATAFNGVKYAEIDGKGEINNRISSTIFRYLESKGVTSHYQGTLNQRDMKITPVTIIPLEVVVRRIVAGSLSKRLGLEEGTELPHTIIEFYYKKDELGDPLLTRDHVDVLGIATDDEIAEIRKQAFAVADVVREFWGKCGLDVIDFKLEFGKTEDGTILLADEISPDTSRLWDRDSGRRMDKDVFRRDLADLGETYREVLGRVKENYPDVEPGDLPEAPAST